MTPFISYDFDVSLGGDTPALTRYFPLKYNRLKTQNQHVMSLSASDAHKIHLSVMADDNDIRNDLIADHLSPYRDALEQVGIGPITVAKHRKKQLNAKLDKFIKLKGDVAVGTKLAPGVIVIAGGGVTETDQGNIVFDDSLIRCRMINWPIQEKATSALEKIFDEPQKSIVEHTGSIDMTSFPPTPRNMEEWEEQYKAMQERKNAANNPNTPGA